MKTKSEKKKGGIELIQFLKDKISNTQSIYGGGIPKKPITTGGPTRISGPQSDDTDTTDHAPLD